MPIVILGFFGGRPALPPRRFFTNGVAINSSNNFDGAPRTRVEYRGIGGRAGLGGTEEVEVDGAAPPVEPESDADDGADDGSTLDIVYDMDRCPQLVSQSWLNCLCM